MSDYEPSDSDDDYNENEKILLKNFKNQNDSSSDSEEGILNVGHSESESENEFADSDIEGQENDDGLPNERAWGKKKYKFYSTDYVDQDYGGFEEKDAELAELEDQEARKLHKQLAEQLDDNDFNLDLFSKDIIEDNKKEKSEDFIKSDLSSLTKKQKIQILKKESPELFGLISDCKEKLNLHNTYLKPIIAKYKKAQISNSPAMDFVHMFAELNLNYCLNVYMYLLLKSHRTNINNHPVVKRLYQFRQLILQIEPTFNEIIKPQIEILLQDVENSKPKEKTNILNLISKIESTESVSQKKKEKKVQWSDKNVLEEDDKNKSDNIPADCEESEGAKRGITYQIAKNKGLTPHRKKEQRNPRVKHRNKYKKALIRRKGAVREVRREISRYGGEISGIKATVSKSIKIKS